MTATKQPPTFDLTPFLTGTNLLLSNAFRITEMPVDAPPKRLKKRQQMVEVAESMEMPIPAGSCPILPLDNQAGEALRGALYKLQDPMCRLLDEFFWFWPKSFGQSDSDPALALLKKGDHKGAVKLWQEGEKATMNFVSTHNLAVWYQLQAILIDSSSIKTNSGSNDLKKRAQTYKDKATSKLWKSSFQRWNLLANEPFFWRYLEKRIRELNDPRLPIEFAEYLKENFTSVLVSINASLILQAAKPDFSEFIEYQKSLLSENGIGNEEVEKALGRLTREIQDKVKHLAEDAENRCKDDPARGDQNARQLLSQVQDSVRILRNLYGEKNKSLIVLSDLVAETVLHCMVQFGNKTQDWEKSIEILQQALPYAIGETARQRITNDIKQVEENKEAGNNWCVPGYFDLPEACVAAFEEARDLVDVEQFDAAIDTLRAIHRGFRDLGTDAELSLLLNHFFAYTFKCKSIVEYNSALSECDAKTQFALKNSISEESAKIASISYMMYKEGQNCPIFCAHCRRDITGSFIVRTIGQIKLPYHEDCSRKIDREIEGFERRVNEVTKSSLECMELAKHFDPSLKPIEISLGIIRKAANEKGIKPRSINELKAAWDLQSIEEIISDILNLSESAYTKFEKIVNKQFSSKQQFSLNLLFSNLNFSDNTRFIEWILPKLASNTFILESLRFALKFGTISLTQDALAQMHSVFLTHSSQEVRNEAIEFFNQRMERYLTLVLERSLEEVGKLPEVFAELIRVAVKKVSQELLSKEHRNAILQTYLNSQSTSIIEALDSLVLYADLWRKEALGILNEDWVRDTTNNFTASISDFVQEVFLRSHSISAEKQITFISLIEKYSAKTEISINRDNFLKCISGVKSPRMASFLLSCCAKEDQIPSAILILEHGEPSIKSVPLNRLRHNLAESFPFILNSCDTRSEKLQESLKELLAATLEIQDSNGHVDKRLLLYSIFSAKDEELSDILIKLNEKLNPEFEVRCRSKDSIRALKFLEKNGNLTQRRVARKILAKERSRGFWGKFNVWQWRPATTFNLTSDSEEDSWIRDKLPAIPISNKVKEKPNNHYSNNKEVSVVAEKSPTRHICSPPDSSSIVFSAPKGPKQTAIRILNIGANHILTRTYLDGQAAIDIIKELGRIDDHRAARVLKDIEAAYQYSKVIRKAASKALSVRARQETGAESKSDSNPNRPDRSALMAEYRHASSSRKWEITRIFQDNGWGNPY